MQHAEIKKPTTKTCTDRPSAECTNHGIQILRKRYTYPPNHSELGNIKYQEQCYGTTDTVNWYQAHCHLLCKDLWIAHVDCDFQATSLHIDTAESYLLRSAKMRDNPICMLAVWNICSTGESGLSSPQHQCAHSLSDALHLFSQKTMNKAMSEQSMHNEAALSQCSSKQR